MSIGLGFLRFMEVIAIAMLFLWAAEASTAATTRERKVVDQPGNSTMGWMALTEKQETSTFPWKGSWKFEQAWFEKKHPWLPKFVTRRVLASTLILGADSYHQVDDEGKPLKEKRILTLLDESEQKVQLLRTEGKKQVHFHLERRDDGHTYYVERGLGDYRILAHVGETD